MPTGIKLQVPEPCRCSRKKTPAGRLEEAEEREERGGRKEEMGIRFVLLVNKQGQTRLAQYYEHLSLDERRALEGEIVRKCLARTDQQVLPAHLIFEPANSAPVSVLFPLLLLDPRTLVLSQTKYDIFFGSGSRWATHLDFHVCLTGTVW
jgi:hypothetical protein